MKPIFPHSLAPGDDMAAWTTGAQSWPYPLSSSPPLLDAAWEMKAHSRLCFLKMHGKSTNAGWYCNAHFKMTFLIITNPFVINEPLSTASGKHLRAIGGLQKGKMSGWEVGIHIIAKGPPWVLGGWGSFTISTGSLAWSKTGSQTQLSWDGMLLSVSDFSHHCDQIPGKKQCNGRRSYFWCQFEKTQLLPGREGMATRRQENWWIGSWSWERTGEGE